MKTTFNSANAYEIIAGHKWQEGYRCKGCGNESYYKGKTPYSRRCSKCKKDESATSGTVFHKLRIPIDASLGIVHLCLNKEKRLSAIEMQSLLKEKSTDIDLKSLSDFRTKILQRIPKRTTPYYIDDVILVQLIYFRSPIIVLYGKTENGIKFSCPHETSKNIEPVIEKHISKEAGLGTYYMNKSNHKIRFRSKPSNYRNKFDGRADDVIEELASMLNFCFDSTKGNMKFQQYCINLYFYLKHGGNFEHLMHLLTATK